APHRNYSVTRRYLILTQTRNGKCGLVAESPPSMLEIPLSTIRPLPTAYRQQGELSFVSHLAVLPKTGGEETIDVFLLGVSPLLGDNETRLDSPARSSQHQFMRISLETFHVLLPVGYIVKAIPFSKQALSPLSKATEGILGDYPWQGETLQLLDLNQLLGYSSLLDSDHSHKTLTILIIQQQQHYLGLLVKAVRQLEWRDLQTLQPINDHPFLQGKFDPETFLLKLSEVIAVTSHQ
ncbi:MAG: chemotaxis protein CheW, partial [Halothece sp. Uz-M2-17]|nr:chemotaxis protein CheW [Halothece sp. Uz-M2-17]